MRRLRHNSPDPEAETQVAAEQTPKQLHRRTTDDDTGEAENHAAKSQSSSDSSARRTPRRPKPKQAAGLATR